MRLKLLTPVKVTAPAEETRQRAKKGNKARVLAVLRLHLAARVLHLALAKEVGCQMPGILDATRGARRIGVAHHEATHGAVMASGTTRRMTRIGKITSAKTIATANPIATANKAPHKHKNKQTNKWC